MTIRYTNYGIPFLFLQTIENLEAVVHGLTVAPTDIILAICGPADIPFALAEYAQKVVAVDVNRLQIRYANARKKALIDGNIDFFLYPDGDIKFAEEKAIGVRNKYYEVHLEAIRARLDVIEFKFGNVNDFCTEQDQYSKVYLTHESPHLGIDLPRIVDSMKENGLVYFAAADIGAMPRDVAKITPHLKVHRGLTTLARRFENANEFFEPFEEGFKPIVYQKIFKP